MKRIAFVDLDGTFVRNNSFHLWLQHLAFAKSRFGAVFRVRVLILVALRACRLISHPSLKKQVQSLFATQPAKVCAGVTAGFVMELRKEIVPAVRQLVERLHGADYQVVMATAAPSEYADVFALQSGFDKCLATLPPSSDGWTENYREAKARRCSLLMAENLSDGTGVIVITDHLDDLPLMRLAEVVVWCGRGKDGLRSLLADRPVWAPDSADERIFSSPSP